MTLGKSVSTVHSEARPPYRVAVHGLPHFCRKLSALLDGGNWRVPYRSPFHPAGLAARVSDLARCDLAYSWTGRINMGKFLWAARKMGKTKIILLWCGSDVIYAKDELATGKIDPWVVDRTHWAVSPWIAEEVRSLGVKCEYVQASFVNPVTPPALPKNFSVLVYLPTLRRAELYGLDRIVEVAKKLPGIQFNLVGLEKGPIANCPPNLCVHGHVNLHEFYQRSTVIWRPVRHDGLSFMVLEAMACGRYVLYSYPLPGCIQVTNVSAACQEIERLRDLHYSGALGLNHEGVNVIARDYDPSVVSEKLRARWETIILSQEVSLSERRVSEAR